MEIKQAKSDAISQHKRMAMGESIEGAPTFGCAQTGGVTPGGVKSKRAGAGTQGAVDVGEAKDLHTDV